MLVVYFNSYPIVSVLQRLNLKQFKELIEKPYQFNLIKYLLVNRNPCRLHVIIDESIQSYEFADISYELLLET